MAQTSRSSPAIGGAVPTQCVGPDGHVLDNGDRIRLASSEVQLVFQREDGGSLYANVRQPAGELASPGIRNTEGLRPEESSGTPIDENVTQLLKLLDAKRGTAVRREELAHALWPERDSGGDGVDEVNEAVAALRAQIEDDPQAPKRLITVGEYGYLLL